MSPPVSRSQPRRAFGSPTANFIKSQPLHAKAKFIDLTKDADGAAARATGSDSDEPIFLTSRELKSPSFPNHASNRAVKPPAGGLFGRLQAERDAFARSQSNGTEPRGNSFGSRQPQQARPQQAQNGLQSTSGSSHGQPSTKPQQQQQQPPPPSSSDGRVNGQTYPSSSLRNPFSNPPAAPPVGLNGDPGNQNRRHDRSFINSWFSPAVAPGSGILPPKHQERPTNGVAAHERPSTRDSRAAAQMTPPSSSRFDTSGQESPKTNAVGKALKITPQKTVWSVDKLVDALQERSIDMKNSHQDLVSFAITSVRPVERRVETGVDLFAGVSHGPVAAEVDKTDDMLKIRIKHHTRGKKDQSTVYYQPLLLKTSKPRVPKYRFHHKEIARNVLTPNTMLKFVPVIRDLEPGEDTQYNTWLKELERMDESAGFTPMGSREQRVIRTTQHERTAMLALYLDYWIDRLGLPGCSRASLIRHMFQSEPDTEMTPHQKRLCDTLQSGGSSPRSPVAAKMARMFTEAFDRVFASGAIAEERHVKLRDVLLLDPTVEEVLQSKKTAKNSSQSQSDDDNDAPAPSYEKMPFEKNLESYVVLGCLICFSNSCEHGDYSDKNQRRNFSLDCNGRMDQLFLKAPGAAEKKDHDGTRIEPCRRDCYMLRDDTPPAQNSMPWSASDEMLLQGMFAAVECSSRVRSKAQCMVAEILNRKCWEVQQRLLKVKVEVAEDTSIALPKAKTLPWYDRHKKMLMGDWQSETLTHDAKSRQTLDPCHHEGPCTLANGCVCVKHHVLCEKFCRCTAECCSYKFTGCACGTTGKTCLQRQKEGRPCICVQLNRECDPSLCHGCGVKERVDPKNREDDDIMDTGCQNCALQRGRSKAVVPGQSQLDGCGYGLYAVEPIAQHDFVIEYSGELIMHDEGVRREARRGEAFVEEGGITSYVFSLLDSEGSWVDAAIYGNHSRYINHEAKDFNVEPKVLYVNGEYRIRFTATRFIDIGDEIFFDYGSNFPNLTKKMINDKTQASDASEPGEPDQSPAKKRGRPAGKTGRPAKKQQAMRKEAPPPLVETLDDLDKLDVAPRGRKRRHTEMAEQDESDDYHPSMEEMSEARGARAQARAAKRRTRLRVESIVPDDVEEAHKEPIRGGRGHTRMSEAEEEQGTPTSMRKRRGRHSKRQRGGRSASPALERENDGAEETPRRGRRRRHPSPPTSATKERAGAKAVTADDDAEEPSQLHTPARMTRYGRRKSRRVADTDDEGTPRGREGPDSADESFSPSGMDLSRSSSRSRRERRKPARYRESEEPL